MENKKVPFRDVELSKWDPRDNRLDENETLLIFNYDGGNYAFNEWWFKEGQYQFNEWCKDHPEYKLEYCKEKQKLC